MHLSLPRRSLLAGAGAAVPIALGIGWGGRVRAADAAPAPPPLDVYGKLPSIENVALSPNGSRVALVMVKDGERLIYDYDLTTGKAAAAAIQSDKLRDLKWADDEHVLAVTSSTQRDMGDVYEEWFGLILGIGAGTRVQMYSFVSGVNQALVYGDFYRIKMNDKFFITASGYKAPDGMNMSNSQGDGATLSAVMDRCLYAFNPQNATAKKLDEDARYIADWAMRADGTLVARGEYDDDTKLWALRYKGDKGWNVIWSLKAPLDRPQLMGLGRDGKSVLLHMQSGDMKNMYVEVAPDGTFGDPISVNGANHYPIFSTTTFNLVGFGNDEGVANYVFYDPTYAKLPALIKGAVGDIHADIVAFADDPLHVVVFVQGDGNPGTYYSIDFRKGGYKEVGEAYPGLPAEWVAAKAPYVYKAADGLDIPAYLTLPPDRDPVNLACVVLPHGGPESFETSSFDFLSQALTSRGYAVLQPNYRGSAGYGKDYTAKGYGEFGRKMQTDLSDGVRDLVKKGMVDPKRVAIFGGSYGGYAALAGVTLDPGIYNCAVSLAGISDIKAFMAKELEWNNYDSNGSGVMYWKRYLGDDKAWDDISPIKHIDAINVPVLLIHGKDDTVVPYEQSTEMYDAMNKAGKSVEMVQLSQEDHWMSREPTRIQVVQSMVNFILKHNPPA